MPNEDKIKMIVLIVRHIKGVTSALEKLIEVLRKEDAKS